MGLNIKNREVETLVNEIAQLTKETKTETIRRALLERQARLKMRPGYPSRSVRLQSLLERRIWPAIPRNVLGRRLSKEAEEKILGFGTSGV
jgi:antitoxin VapB